MKTLVSVENLFVFLLRQNYLVVSLVFIRRHFKLILTIFDTVSFNFGWVNEILFSFAKNIH